MKSRKQIILLGGGGHCESCIDVIEQSGEYEIIGILDMPEKVGRKILNTFIIGIDEDIVKFKKTVKYYFITVGQIRSAERRILLYNLLKKHKIQIPTINSPNAYVSPHSQIGGGTIIMHHAIINAGAKLGNNCIINSRALIEHDAIIGNHCHISTGAIINGEVKVGDQTFFGSGAVAIQGSIIPDNSFIKANSLYVR
jgi:sugar O-acyltransferase (sialic acid O-acetyltransferase NeuD family)